MRHITVRTAQWLMCLSVLGISLAWGTAASQEETGDKTRVIRARVQPRPGAEIEEFDMEVHRVPTELTTVEASTAGLADDEIVLGVIVGDQVMAYPIRYLAMYEIVGDRVGTTPIAPSW